jgi:predicted RNA-binding Zn-ribbon protein involved in translation (DUF1610 family)
MAGDVSPTLVFLVIFIVVFLIGIAYALMVLKRRAHSKVTKLKESNVEDDAYNQIQIVKSMAKVMKSKGYNVAPVENMIVKAETAYSYQRYLESIDIVNNAKRALWRLKEEQKESESLSPEVKKELEIIKKIEKEPDTAELPPQIKDFEKKLPPNYLQSKFEIGVVEEKIVKMEEGQLKEYAKLYMQRAKRAFDMGDYSEALRLAVKGNKIIDTGEIPKKSDEVEKIEETKPVVVQPLIVEEGEEELHCPNCGAVVRPEDKYCWNCGAKLVWTYRCPNCGAEVTTEDKYCRNCGYKLR